MPGFTVEQGPPQGGPFLSLRGWLLQRVLAPRSLQHGSLPHDLLLQPCLAALLVCCALHAEAQTQPQPQPQPLTGPHRIVLHSTDGQRLVVGQVTFTPATAEGLQRFELKMDHSRFTDYFLSMREMKCLPGGTEILCHIPYPHPQPGTITATDLGWLEHALMFMYKKPGEFGAKFYNGVYFQLRRTERGLEGKPQAVDLNLIAAPPARADVPPFRPALRDDMAAGSRWFERLTIE